MPSSDTNIREKKLSQQKTPLQQDQRTSHQMKTRNVEQQRQKTPNQHLLRMRKKYLGLLDQNIYVDNIYKLLRLNATSYLREIYSMEMLFDEKIGKEKRVWFCNIAKSCTYRVTGTKLRLISWKQTPYQRIHFRQKAKPSKN